MGGSSTVKQFASFMVVVLMAVFAPAGVSSTIESFAQDHLTVPRPWPAKRTSATRQVSVVNPSAETLDPTLRQLEIAGGGQKIANVPALQGVIHELKISHSGLKLGEK